MAIIHDSDIKESNVLGKKFDRELSLTRKVLGQTKGDGTVQMLDSLIEKTSDSHSNEIVDDIADPNSVQINPSKEITKKSNTQ